MAHTNIEIKARSTNQDQIRAFFLKNGADFKGTDHQIDTYFKVENGRLKLREGNIENQLIFYERDDKAGPKESKVVLYPFDPTSSLKEVLIKSLPTLVVVDKQREIYYIANVKFHIDTVKELGTFVEIEAQDNGGVIAKEIIQAQCDRYLKAFDIEPEDLLAVSYSDLLISSKK